MFQNIRIMSINHRQKYPLSTADFERIRTDGYLYVDKTDYVHALVSSGIFYFLSRPRRFGKSLLLSTLEAYFLGKRHLFQGLALDRLQPGEWNTYPVLRLNLSGKRYADENSLLSELDMHLERWEKSYGVTDPRKDVDERFEIVIQRVAAVSGKKVVVLVDEYDSPLSDSIGNQKLQDHYRDQLHGFYSVLKKTEEHIQFCLLTGVTKFGKVSVFSGLNNLKDITFLDAYAGICGITERELHSDLYPGVVRLAETEGCTVEEAFGQLKFNYDGYHFSKSLLDIYNPFSLMNALDNSELSSYWCASGVPTLLSKSLHNSDYDLKQLNYTQVTKDALENLSVYRTDPVALFYQTGYLTIKNYDQATQLYTLGYPNREIERGIFNNILNLYIPSSPYAGADINLMRGALLRGDPQDFVARLKAYLSGIPSDLRVHVSKYENYYHTIFYCIASLIGLDVNVEYNTSRGFIDMLIRTPEYIYVIELKVNGSAAVAMRQIEKMGYAEPFVTDPRTLYLIGLGFSKKTASISSCKIEKQR